ncbi:MAG TPA: glycosyltransferase family 4 protein [Vicinamibacterales bacterium]|nr:glycosyltransferase family 4 protein [Vicinamibacterales bacterium]
MHIAFVVQRYGTEILGGSEYHCRLIAERMAFRPGSGHAAQHEVEVLTTCARDYITWTNEYPEGVERINGVTVLRFANAETRDIEAFNRYSEWIFHNPHTPEDEMWWLEQQGPWCPPLLEYLTDHAASYDAVIFFTYLYAPTVLGLRIAPERSILVPTAHNEPAIHLDLYKDLFTRPKAIAFNTEVEKSFLKSTFDIRAAEETVGCGVDLLARDAAPTDALRTELPAGPFLLYGGRIDAGKGCDQLLDFFQTYKEQGGPATLVLMGAKLMPLPDVPWVRYVGLLSEADRLRALEAATIVVVPSPFESLSLLALEGMAVGNPVLCNAHADVLVDHCTRSNAGLFYSTREEFVECIHLLLADRDLRERMGRNGKAYVTANYSWNVIMAKYDALMASLPKA